MRNHILTNQKTMTKTMSMAVTKTLGGDLVLWTYHTQSVLSAAQKSCHLFPPETFGQEKLWTCWKDVARARKHRGSNWKSRFCYLPKQTCPDGCLTAHTQKVFKGIPKCWGFSHDGKKASHRAQPGGMATPPPPPSLVCCSQFGQLWYWCTGELVYWWLVDLPIAAQDWPIPI